MHNELIDVYMIKNRNFEIKSKIIFIPLFHQSNFISQRYRLLEKKKLRSDFWRFRNIDNLSCKIIPSKVQKFDHF